MLPDGGAGRLEGRLAQREMRTREASQDIARATRGQQAIAAGVDAWRLPWAGNDRA